MPTKLLASELNKVELRILAQLAKLGTRDHVKEKKKEIRREAVAVVLFSYSLTAFLIWSKT